MLLLYSPQRTARADYIFKMVFKEFLEIPYCHTQDLASFIAHQEEKINYSVSRIENEFFIRSSPLLYESGIRKKEIKVTEKYQTVILFPHEDCDLGFDLFSAAFYLLSRYEEYLPFTPDRFGRFKAKDSLAYRHHFLHLPLIDQWVAVLKRLLKEKFPSLQLPSRNFKAMLTYDIDIAFRYKGRNWARIVGASIKDLTSLKFRNTWERFRVLTNQQKDPWDIYDHLQQMIQKYQLPAVFFFLLADKTVHDRNLDFRTTRMKELVLKTKSFADIGIHPSFLSSAFPEKITLEKERLEQLSGQQITRSRQHYLKAIMPDTFNSLVSAGIEEDYSMGFADMPGFRAGTCTPFYLYDLKKESETSLRLFPVTCMDATFNYYSKKTPEKSLLEILQLLKEIKKVNGLFISIFHNDHLGENRKASRWGKVHDQMIQQIRTYLKIK